jgi:FkbM family methyltransferase
VGGARQQQKSGKMTNTLTVFDVGLHTGQDTAFYLSLGHKVVAVEANPLLVSQARQRFREAIGSGRLSSVEGCIAGQGSGVVSFYVNQTDSALSSFCRHAAGRMGHSLEEIVVSQVQLGPLFREHGVPHYLKMDIEGADKFVWKS